jgi:hypothetical protein
LGLLLTVLMGVLSVDRPLTLPSLVKGG